MAKKTYKSKWIKVRGLCSYAKIYEPDDRFPPAKWKVNIHTDVDQTLKIKEIGIKKVFKDPNEEFSGVPGKFFTFDRPVEKEFSSGIQVFSPPEVLDKDGTKLVSYRPTDNGFERMGDKVFIGNGSTVELDIVVYPAGTYGKGCRLNSIRIIDLIEFIPPDTMSENDVDDDEAPFDVEDKVEEKTEESKPEKGAGRKASW